jgi:hypothetical protein
MKQRFMCLCCWLVGLLWWPAIALAEDEAKLDARVDSFGKAVKVDPASSTLLWGLFVILAAICVAVLFKDAKRSHLD